MTSHTKPDESGIELYKYLDGKVENLRNDVAEAIKHDMELALKMDRLTERVDKGVAVTGQETLRKVTELVTSVAEYRVMMDKQATQIAEHQKTIDRMVNSVFTVAVVGVIGGLASLAFKAFG